MNGKHSKLGSLYQAPVSRANIDPEILLQVNRFPRIYQNRMIRLVGRGPELVDLMMGYPAFAFALATDYGSVEDANDIIAWLKEGQSSKKLADLYGLPRWLRKLPPEAFLRHIPIFHQSDDFHRRMAAYVPTQPNIAAQWFIWVMKALEVEGESLALWLAAQPLFRPQEIMPMHDLLAPIFLYAAYGLHKLEGDSALLIKRGWQPKMKLETALTQMQEWFGQVNSSYFEALKNHQSQKRQLTEMQRLIKDWGPWIKRSYVKGFHFVPLLNLKALVEEGQKMHHCVGTYGGLVQNGDCAIYSVRDKHDNRVATLELRHSCHDRQKAEIIQISARSNATPKPAIKLAADLWLKIHEQTIRLPPKAHYSNFVSVNRISHWDAYWDKKPNLRAKYQWHWDNPAFLENAMTRLRGMAG